jgi:hypothetical protein
MLILVIMGASIGKFKIIVIGLAKNIFQVCRLSDAQCVLFHHRVKCHENSKVGSTEEAVFDGDGTLLIRGMLGFNASASRSDLVLVINYFSVIGLGVGAWCRLRILF